MPAISYLKRWFASPSYPRIAPGRPVVVVGDVHGRADLLVDLLEAVSARIGSSSLLVFVGDYIDRGEDSAQVLGIIKELQREIWPNQVICLRGNHEAMMLGFLDDPEASASVWLRNGGRHTLASFGVRLPDGTVDDLYRARDDLRKALGRDDELWLRGMPVSYLSGNVFISHAGADPARSIDEQSPTDLLWGHPDFLTTSRTDGVWVAHGHTIFERPSAEHGRISIDTGGYATNRLTAALLSDGNCRFVTTNEQNDANKF